MRGGGGGVRGAQDFDYEELLKAFRGGGRGAGAGARRGFGGFEDIFSEIFSFSGQSAGGRTRYYTAGDHEEPGEEMPPPGRTDTDIRSSIEIKKDRAEKGGAIKVRSPKGETLTVTLPKGVASGKQLRLAGQGKECPCCGKRGDLYLTVRVK